MSRLRGFSKKPLVFIFLSPDPYSRSHHVVPGWQSKGPEGDGPAHQPHFRYLQNRTRVSVWLYENVNTKIEGHIVGFDEYMNLVLADAAEVHIKKGTTKNVGTIMLKGDNITLIQSKEQPATS
ncbi:Small nuclear ribonucleoprotein E [Caligus rogercresseyi]|uniref:Small nuclear ribonucleoprotein E n=1 Tax=Caligus rogercresseyi TaxID=217165 RepID=A0A7T8JX05_CALRO|nr:Small nuclear ribonucleoprotein E [Caligus rogercresseyi]